MVSDITFYMIVFDVHMNYHLIFDCLALPFMYDFRFTLKSHRVPCIIGAYRPLYGVHCKIAGVSVLQIAVIITVYLEISMTQLRPFFWCKDEPHGNTNKSCERRGNGNNVIYLVGMYICLLWNCCHHGDGTMIAILCRFEWHIRMLNFITLIQNICFIS